MSAIAEIDKAGRIVVPKRLRDALHLVPGTRVTFREQGGELVIAAEAKPRGLYMERGTLVYDPGFFAPVNVVDWLKREREERADSLTPRSLKQ